MHLRCTQNALNCTAACCLLLAWRKLDDRNVQNANGLQLSLVYACIYRYLSQDDFYNSAHRDPYLIRVSKQHCPIYLCL